MKYLLFLIVILFCSSIYAQWEPDRKLSTGEINATTNENMGQCIAVNGNVIHVVWSDVIKGSGIYYKRSTDAGLTWGPDTRLTAIPNISDFPSISVVGNYIHVAYRDSAAGLRTSNYIRSTDGGNTWETPVSLGAYYWWPSIAASGSNVFVALNSNATGNSEVWCRRSTDNGTSWDPVVQISNAPGRSEDPSIATGGGYVHLAWNDNRTDTMQTFYRRSTDLGVTWGPEIQRTHTTTFAYCPVLSVSDTNVDLVWADRRTGSYNIFHLLSTDYGTDWGFEEQLSLGTLGSVYPNIVRSGSYVHVIWVGSGLFYLHSGDGGATWDNPVTLVSASSQPSMAFIAVTGTVVHVIWTDNRDGHHAIYYKRNPTGNSESSQNNSITITSLPSQFCNGASFSLQYKKSGTFFGDNVFTAQLSDGTGNFANAVDIGSINSTSSGTISATLPSDKIPATGYRMRVNSSSPVTTGTDNGFDITINALPSPKIKGVFSTCWNTSQTYTSTSVPGHSYKWTVDGGDFQGADNQIQVTVNWNTSNTIGTINLTETINSTGCSNIDSRAVAVNQLPAVAILGLPSGCRNALQTFTTIALPGHSYKWTVEGGTIIGSDNDSVLVVKWETAKSSGTITLNETNDITGCSDSHTHIIAVNSLPVPTMSGSLLVCNNSTQVYSTITNAGHSYLWTVDGGSISGANNHDSVQVNWNTSNTIGTLSLVETIDSTGCTDSIYKQITVIPLPGSGITGKDTVEKGSSYTYTANPTDGTYKWEVVNGIITSPATNQTVDITWESGNTGKVKLTETNKEGCTDSASLDVTYLVNSVQDRTGSGICISIIPNPVSGRAEIEITSGKAMRADIQIVNSLGIIVKEFNNVILSEGTQKLSWDGNGKTGEAVPAGVYFVKISGKYGVTSAKAILLR